MDQQDKLDDLTHAVARIERGQFILVLMIAAFWLSWAFTKAFPIRKSFFRIVLRNMKILHLCSSVALIKLLL